MSLGELAVKSWEEMILSQNDIEKDKAWATRLAKQEQFYHVIGRKAMDIEDLRRTFENRKASQARPVMSKSTSIKRAFTVSFKSRQ